MVGNLEFKVIAEDGSARVGRLSTVHGSYETPGFWTAATYGKVNLVSPEEFRTLGIDAVIANTFHLWRFGYRDICKNGGLRSHMKLDGEFLATDSGGFQVMSYGDTRESGGRKIAFLERPHNTVPAERKAFVTEEGVRFVVDENGSEKTLMFTPELSVEIQEALGPDVMFAFDQCHTERSYGETREAMERTHRWEKRSLNAKSSSSALYGIIHGGIFQDLREASARFVSGLPFEGLSIGGYLGVSKPEMHRILEYTIAAADRNRPMHLLGIGRVDDIFEGVARGIDTFDCVEVTRWGRHDRVIVSPETNGNHHALRYVLDLKPSQHRQDSLPLDVNCSCATCKRFARADLIALRLNNKTEYMKLLTQHNVFFISNLFREIRDAIREERFEELRRYWLNTK